MDDRYGISRYLDNPSRPGKYHICRYLETTAICGVLMPSVHDIGQWDIDRAVRFAKKMADKRQLGVCKRCLKASKT